MAALIRVVTLLGLALAASAGRSSTKNTITPLQKVINMLDEVMAKGKKEKIDEETEFNRFRKWCDDTKATTKKSIADGKALIEQLDADIEKAEADAQTFAQEIAEMEADVSKKTKELEKATSIRKAEKADYDRAFQDLSDTIDACVRAIQYLISQEHDTPQAKESLLQISNSNSVNKQEKAIIDSFLYMRKDDEAAEPGSYEAPEADAYEFQSGSIKTMLRKIQLKVEDERLALQKEEMNAKNSFELLAQHLTDDIRYNKKSIKEKTALKASRLEEAANAKADKATAEATLAADEKTLDETNVHCLSESIQYEKNQNTRADEIKAIMEALKILRSGSVSGHATTYLPAASLAQGTVLAQLRSQADQETTRRRVVEFLQSQAAKTGSKYLQLVARRAGEDPFGKVKKMIKDLIVKLMEQANVEADQHAYCQTELATNKQTREIKSSEVDELTANIDELTAKSAQLAEEIARSSEMITELRASQAEATTDRGAEKAINDQTVADAKEAQAAVEAAIKVLRDYYAKAKDAALLQGGEELSQEMTNALSPYKGMQAESGGIFGMLEVILSDFARLEAETTTSEDAAQAAYEKFMDESNETLAVKTAEMKHNENRKQQTDDTNQKQQRERDITQKELDAAMEYYDKLHDECIDTKLSYKERVAAREEEIQSLTEALRILQNSDVGSPEE